MSKQKETASDTLCRWMNESYTSQEVREYYNKEEMEFEISEMAHESRATMHYDDPSLIELFDELEKIEKLMKEPNG